MAYSADSFTALEVPTLAKMNKLWSNDASFNDGTGIANNAILTRHILTSNVTTPKVKLSTIDYEDAGAASNFSVTATTMTDVSGISTTYTSGATAERLILFMQFMATSTSSYGFYFTLNVNGVDGKLAYTTIINAKWDTITKMYIFDIPASTTVTIKPRAYTQSGGNISWGRDNTNGGFRTKITGVAMSNA